MPTQVLVTVVVVVVRKARRFAMLVNSSYYQTKLSLVSQSFGLGYYFVLGGVGSGDNLGNAKR